jgi:tetratricopeptide (TPR) repeat protein
MIRHLSRCARCRLVVESMAQISVARRSYMRRAVLSVAAGLVAVLSAFLLVRGFGPWHADPLGSLAQGMPLSARTIEPRLSGFPWAPLHSLRRGGAGKSPEELIIAGAAGGVLKDIGGKSSPGALHTAGVAYVLQNDTPRGVARLKETAARTPRDAAVWSDLAAALYCDSMARDDRAQLSEAIAAADRAIALDQRMPEPYFNRALIVESTGSAAAAVAAWNAFLAVDSESGWAGEARRHLREISAGRHS